MVHYVLHVLLELQKRKNQFGNGSREMLASLAEANDKIKMTQARIE